MREGKLAPDRAEELAFATGQPPFVRVTEADRIAVQSAQWPLTLAIFWTAWEDLDQVIQAQADFRYWKGAVWRSAKQSKQKMSYAEAEHNVLEDLKSGKLKSAALLGGERQRIEPQTWINAQWEDVLKREHFTTEGRSRLVSPLIDALHVRDERLDGDEASAMTIRNPGGRKKEYDEVEFLIRAMHLIYDNPKGFFSQTDLNEKTAELYRKDFGLSSKKLSLSWGAPLIKKLWDALELEAAHKNPRK